MAELHINSGRKELAIIRNGENVGSIYFSPTDASILKRLEEARDGIKIAVEGHDERKKMLDESLDPLSKAQAQLLELERVDKDIRALIDYAFDYPCSDIVFGNSFIFAVDENGATQVEQFLSGAMEFIQGELKKENEAAQKRRGKYLDKYTQ